NTSTTSYDEDGNVAETVDAEGNYTQYTYNAEGQVLTEQTYDSHDTLVSSRSYTYDAAGRLTKVTDDHATGTTRETTYTYDAAGRQTSVTDAEHKTASTSFDPAGRVSETIDADHNVTDYSYNALGQVLKEDLYQTLTDGSKKLVSSTSDRYDV